MIWSRLKNYKCPTCNRVLCQGDDGKILCLRGHFSVEYEQFEYMVNLLYRVRKPPDDWKRFCKVEQVILNKT